MQQGHLYLSAAAQVPYTRACSHRVDIYLFQQVSEFNTLELANTAWAFVFVSIGKLNAQ